MNLLVLGGTVFLGRHVVEAALAAGHRVSLFNRGRRTVAFPGAVEALVGDRDADTSALRGRTFDAVIDCSGYRPSQIASVAASLQPHLPHWVFVSSISVVARFPPGRSHDETAAVTTQDTGYGGEKARAEEALRALCPDRAAIVRPGLIVGRHDPTGRFAYWPWRLAQGGTVLAPGRPERPVQVIDARDLATWCVSLAETRHSGTFNAVGPPMSMRSLLETCRDVAGSDAHLVWRSDAELLAAGVTPWTGLPLWIPEDDPDFGGMLLARSDRAVAAGLRTRPMADTVADVLDALRADPAGVSFPNVMSAELQSPLCGTR
ncbi:MAG TPA: NAD-dependent epimerase/dehydratase family protein [Albitalea sp.]|uniref:NAD-dependent epimerase/dehydratase family protein n=1 Tax=Piscinibacter sp. TaxID=1903157 RepID=UPI002ED16C0D